jgi:hypothetical protein
MANSSDRNLDELLEEQIEFLERVEHGFNPWAKTSEERWRNYSPPEKKPEEYCPPSQQ